MLSSSLQLKPSSFPLTNTTTEMTHLPLAHHGALSQLKHGFQESVEIPELSSLFLQDKRMLRRHIKSNTSTLPSTLFTNQLMFNLNNKKEKTITEEMLEKLAPHGVLSLLKHGFLASVEIPEL